MIPICPHCGREFESASGGFQNHVRSCGNRPEDDELLADHETLTMLQMADKYDVSRDSISKWLKEAKANGRHGRGATNRDLELDTECAPAFGKTTEFIKKVHPRQLIVSRGPCGFCPLREHCQSLMLEIGWVLCEAPDKAQLERWAGAGIDPKKIIESLSIAKLVENASCTNS